MDSAAPRETPQQDRAAPRTPDALAAIRARMVWMMELPPDRLSLAEEDRRALLVELDRRSGVDPRRCEDAVRLVLSEHIWFDEQQRCACDLWHGSEWTGWRDHFVTVLAARLNPPEPQND